MVPDDDGNDHGLRHRDPRVLHLHLGFGVWGLGFVVRGVGFGVWCLVCGVWCVVCGVWCVGFGVGVSVSGFGFRFRVLGSSLIVRFQILTEVIFTPRSSV